MRRRGKGHGDTGISCARSCHDRKKRMGRSGPPPVRGVCARDEFRAREALRHAPHRTSTIIM